MPLSDFDRTYLIRRLVKYNTYRLAACFIFGLLTGIFSVYIAFVHHRLLYGLLVGLGGCEIFIIYFLTWPDDDALLGEETSE